jgi:hypothetical protein
MRGPFSPSPHPRLAAEAPATDGGFLLPLLDDASDGGVTFLQHSLGSCRQLSPARPLSRRPIASRSSRGMIKRREPPRYTRRTGLRTSVGIRPQQVPVLRRQWHGIEADPVSVASASSFACCSVAKGPISRSPWISSACRRCLRLPLIMRNFAIWSRTACRLAPFFCRVRPHLFAGVR